VVLECCHDNPFMVGNKYAKVLNWIDFSWPCKVYNISCSDAISLIVNA
jgi:hypothetical protein